MLNSRQSHCTRSDESFQPAGRTRHKGSLRCQRASKKTGAALQDRSPGEKRDRQGSHIAFALKNLTFCAEKCIQSSKDIFQNDMDRSGPRSCRGGSRICVVCVLARQNLDTFFCGRRVRGPEGLLGFAESTRFRVSLWGEWTHLGVASHLDLILPFVHHEVMVASGG